MRISIMGREIPNKTSLRIRYLTAILALSVVAAFAQLKAEEDSSVRAADDGPVVFLALQDTEPVEPEEPGPEEEEPILEFDISELGGVEITPDRFAPEVRSSDVDDAGRRSVFETPGADIVSGIEARSRVTTDAGDLLAKSIMNPGVFVKKMNPIIGDPRIRGYHFGQYLAVADGAFWFPARLDADSIISKIDSKIIDDVIIINGPYSARYGPAFAIIDIVTRSTPRSNGGPGRSGATGLTYNGNGQQWNGYQYFEHGSDHWGASFYYSHLTGADYRDGSGRRIPSSYNSRNFNVAIGADLTSQTSLEFRYLRQDQTDVELAGQFTDIDYLVTDGFSAKLTSENHGWFDLLSLNGWYNRTRAQGSGGRAPKQALFNSVFDQPAPFGGLTLPRDSLSDFDVASTGFTLALTRGEETDIQLIIGADLRHYQRSLNETLFRADGTGGFKSGTKDVFTLIPKSESTNPGIFSELIVPANDRTRIKSGARVDWVSVSAGPGIISRRDGLGMPLDVLGPDRDNSYTLWSAYVTLEHDMTEVLTANIGFGLAERPPTLTELYAMRPFESVLQQGLNRIQGFPLLRAERLKQLDVGFRADNGRFRGGMRGFYAWIGDYITSQGIAVDPTSSSARITSVFVNTPEATLAGGEAYGELYVSQKFTLFGNLMYVEGRNHTLNQFLFTQASAPPGSNQGAYVGRDAFDQTVGQEPLPQIPPLESRVGVRMQQPVRDPRWALEFMARIVDNQDRVASRSLLEQVTPGFTTLDLRGYWRPHDNVIVNFGVLNLTDKLYREHLDTRAGNQLFQPGITGYVGSELTY